MPNLLITLLLALTGLLFCRCDDVRAFADRRLFDGRFVPQAAASVEGNVILNARMRRMGRM